MRPIEALPDAVARGVTAVFTDIDDTLTLDGRVPAAAFTALWRLAEAGVAVVPVTGRPAGWCDHLARAWPVAGVVGENGAFYFRHDPARGRLVQRFLLDADARRGLQARLADLGARILAEVPGAALASDQPYRIHDLAIDFCEDVPRLPESAVDRIVALFEEAGATAKVSSIHINGWFGRHDKLGMIRLFAAEVLGLDVDREADRARCLYAGDSPNDEPAFAFFEGAVGVANVREHLHRLRHPPAVVTAGRGGEGFAELAARLLAAR